MTFRDLCTKEIVQLQNGVCLGKADDLEFDPQTAEITSLQLLGQPRLFGLMGREETLTIRGMRSSGSGWMPFWCARSCRCPRKQRQNRRAFSQSCAAG